MPRNRKSINLLKAVFATTFMGLASYLIFARLYFPKAGLSESEFGILLSIPGIILLVSQPAWSVFTDYTGSVRRNFQVMLAGTAGFLLFYYFFQDFFLAHFYALLLLMAGFSFFYTARGPIRNSLALSFVSHGQEGFGRIRLWASIGWAVGALGIAFVLFQTSLDLLFPLASIFFLISALIAFFLDSPRQETLETINIFKSQEIRKALENRRLWIFLGFLFLTFVGINGVTIFLPLYLEGHFGLNLIWLGVFYAFLALAEVPFFYYGDEIIEKVGIRRFLISGFGIQGFAWILFGLFTFPEMLIVVLLLRGVGYSFTYLGSVNYIDHEVTEKTRTVGQSLFITTAFGVAAVVGRTAWGFLAETISMPSLYLLGGVLGLVSTAGLILFWSVSR